MAKVTDPMGLFEYKLGVALATEKVVERSLKKLAKEANTDELRRGFETHLEETRGHIERVQQVAEQFGATARGAKSPAAEGLELQHSAFASVADEAILPEVLDLVALSSACATEHHEIALYEDLIQLAGTLGMSAAVLPLEEVLQQERNMLERAKQMAGRIGASASGNIEGALQPTRAGT